MAQFKSATYTAQETAGQKSASMIENASLISGKIQFLQAEVTIPAGTGSADTILACYIPAGVTIVPGLVTITTAVVCGAGTFDIGFASDDDAIAAAVTCNALGVANLGTKSTVASVANSASQALILTLNGALTEGGKFFLNIPLVNSN